MTERVLAPFGRRSCEVVANEATGGYRIVSALDREGPEPEAGQFYMLATEAWGGAERAALSAASLLGRRGRGRGGRSAARLPARGGRPRDLSDLAALKPGRAAAGHRTARAAVLGPCRARAGGGRRGAGRRRDRDRAAGDPAPPTRRLAASRSGSCSAFATAPTPAGWSCFAARRCGPPPRTGTRATRATSPTCSRWCSRETTRAAPWSMPAARRRCWRRCGCSAASAASPPSWRWRRRWPAASAPASAARCRWPAAATCGSASTARPYAPMSSRSALVAGSGH